MSKTSIASVRKKAQGSVDKAEGVISRFSRFMGTTSKSVAGDIPSDATIKKARKFAKNFQGGKSRKIGKLLLGSALILPVVLGGAMKARAASSTDILNQQYGGDENLMKKDLDAERKSLDKGIKNVEGNVEGNKESLEKQKSEISTKEPEQPQIEPSLEEETTQERNKDPFASQTEIDLVAFEEAIDKFVFLSKQGMLFGDKGPGFFEKVGNFLKNTVKSEKGDGFLGPKWLGLRHPFSPVWQRKTYENKENKNNEISEVYLSKVEPLETVTGKSVDKSLKYDLPADVKNDKEFMSGISELSKKHNVPQEDLLAMMDFETGGTFDPATKNMAGSGATGLIQFMPDTAKSLGTTTEELSEMSRSEQLQYVDKYLETNLGGRIDSDGADISDLYMSVLFPVAVGTPDDFVLFGKGAISEKYEGRAYDANRGLDANNDGSITKVEAAAKVINLRDKNMKTDLSSVETPTDYMTAMKIPEKYMDYDDPSGGGESETTQVSMMPSPQGSGGQQMSQPMQGGGESEDIVMIAASTTEVLNSMQLQSLGAS